MPAHRRYKTKAEKQAANRAKSKRYYDRNKITILAQRREQRPQQVMTRIAPPSKIPVPKNQSIAEPTKSLSRLEKWIEYSIQVFKRLDRITQGNNNQFFEQLYSTFAFEYAAGNSTEHIFDDPLKSINKIFRSMERCSARILREAGMGMEFEAVEDKLTKIRDVIKSIEEMACEAIDDPSRLICTRTQHRLASRNV